MKISFLRNGSGRKNVVFNDFEFFGIFVGGDLVDDVVVEDFFVVVGFNEVKYLLWFWGSEQLSSGLQHLKMPQNMHLSSLGMGWIGHTMIILYVR